MYQGVWRFVYHKRKILGFCQQRGDRYKLGFQKANPMGTKKLCYWKEGMDAERSVRTSPKSLVIKR